MTGQMTSSVWHLLTRVTADISRTPGQPHEPTEAEKLAHKSDTRLMGAKVAYVDADKITKAACVDAAGMTLTECGRTMMMRETQTNSSSKQ